MSNIKCYGWDVFDVVTLIKEWCVICTKSRHHEEFQGYKICTVCGDIQTPQQQMAEQTYSDLLVTPE